MNAVVVVHSGEPWGHSQLPCSRQMIPFLEKNESLVTWVQVSSSGVFYFSVYSLSEAGIFCSLWTGLYRISFP